MCPDHFFLTWLPSLKIAREKEPRFAVFLTATRFAVDEHEVTKVPKPMP
jgi:hypothetical protein